MSSQAALIREFGGAIYAADDQAAGIQEVLGLKVPRRPLATRLKFDPQEVSDLAIHTVSNFAEQFSLGIADAKVGLQRDGLIELKTRSGERNIFQIGYSFANAPGLVLPLDIHHIRTQHPGLYAPVEHTLLIGERKVNDYDGSATKIALTGRKA
jgi:hypothetical protein